MLPELAHAASGAHGHAPSFADIIPYWINFSLYVLVLFFLLRKPIAKGWNGRTEAIAAAVNKGKTEREQAEQLLAAAKSKQSSLASEIAALVAQIKNETAAETQEILKDSAERAERIKTQGKEMLAAEEKAFKSALRKELADEVLKRATDILKKDLNASSDATLRTSSMNTVGQLLN